jgi:hypothetical protein
MYAQPVAENWVRRRRAPDGGRRAALAARRAGRPAANARLTAYVGQQLGSRALGPERGRDGRQPAHAVEPALHVLVLELVDQDRDRVEVVRNRRGRAAIIGHGGCGWRLDRELAKGE